MTDPDKLAEYLSGEKYPLGVSLRQHLTNYIAAANHSVGRYSQVLQDVLDEIEHLGEDNPAATEKIHLGMELKGSIEATQCHIQDLAELCEFMDWEHAFHEIDPATLTPGRKYLRVLAIRGAEDGRLQAYLSLMNGSQELAAIPLGVDGLDELISGLMTARVRITEDEEEL